jgi:hypothetical protein
LRAADERDEKRPDLIQEAALAADQTPGEAETTDAVTPDRDNADSSHQRAVVAINPMVTERRARSHLADVMFLAHMVATKFRAPQTCSKRRAEPGDADVSYRKAAQPAVRTGRIVSRRV